MIWRRAGVVLGHDARRTGPQYLTITARSSGLGAGRGLSAWRLFDVFFYYSAMRHPSCAAVMVGARTIPRATPARRSLGPAFSRLRRRSGRRAGSTASRNSTWPDASHASGAAGGSLPAKT